MFRILIVDDNPADVYALREVLKSLGRPHQIHWAKDGGDAVRLLEKWRSEAQEALPNLILMDINMPRVNGFQALHAIKNDPELRIIPVIMLSTSTLPEDVRRSYHSHAASFVQKPASLQSCERLARAIEAFWIDFTIFPLGEKIKTQEIKPLTGIAFGGGAGKSRGTDIGTSFAVDRWEAKSQATVGVHSASDDCDENRRLLDDFGAAVGEVMRLHQVQFRAIVHGDPECNRFDLLIHMANEKKQQAKYAYLRHVESHGCSNLDGIDETRT